MRAFGLASVSWSRRRPIFSFFFVVTICSSFVCFFCCLSSRTPLFFPLLLPSFLLLSFHPSHVFFFFFFFFFSCLPVVHLLIGTCRPEYVSLCYYYHLLSFCFSLVLFFVFFVSSHSILFFSLFPLRPSFTSRSFIFSLLRLLCLSSSLFCAFRPLFWSVGCPSRSPSCFCRLSCFCCCSLLVEIADQGSSPIQAHPILRPLVPHLVIDLFLGESTLQEGEITGDHQRSRNGR